MEEDLYTTQLEVWEVINRQLIATLVTVAEIREHENRRPIREYRFAGVPFMIDR